MNQKTVEVVAAVITRGDRLLLAQRNASSDQAGLWEFPGGKVEAGETQYAALQRELYEELSVNIQSSRYIASTIQKVGDRLIHLHAWHVAGFCGEPQAHCHFALHWVTPGEATGYPLAPADIPLLQAFMALKII
ncbi:pyrimidine (deoxy)nucleoside triphosphate diphosphatase [Enterobacteriaceae bacterium LUAb1]